MERKKLSTLLTFFKDVDCTMDDTTIYHIKEGYMATFRGARIVAFDVPNEAKPNRLHVKFETYREYNRLSYAQIQEIEVFELAKVY